MIVLKNWENCDLLHHSLVTLKGRVDNIKHGEIYISVNGGNALSWPVIDYSFQALVELKPGKNSVNMRCGTESRELLLTYDKSKRRRFVRVVYIVCTNSNGEFQGPAEEDRSVKSAQARLSFAAKVIQSLTAEKIRDSGFEPSTFSLEENLPGGVICHVFRSKLTIEETHAKDEQALWDHFALELMNSDLKNDDCKYLAFLSSTRYIGVSAGEKQPTGFSQVRSLTRGRVALGGGGLALIGTACLYTWPKGLDDFQLKIEDTRPVDTSRFMDDSCNRCQLWACYVSGLGASLHELAHTFDVGHSVRGIMGLGFHQLQQELQVHEQKTCCVCSRNACFQEKLDFRGFQPMKNSVIPGQNVMKPKLSQWTTPCVHCPEGPFWNPSTAHLLYYHRWFQEEDEDEETEPLTCETTLKGWLICSTHGVAVAELRDATGLVLAYWIHAKSTPPPVVHLPRGSLSWKAQSLVVQDTKGNLFKTELSSVGQKTCS